MSNRRILKPFLASFREGALDPLPWADMTAGQLAQLRAAAAGVERQSRAVGRLMGALVWLGLVGWLGFLMLQTPGQTKTEVAVMLGLFAVSAGAVIALFVNMSTQGGLGGMEAGWLRHMLQPMNEQDDLCAEAVGWLQYPSVRNYRDLVNKQGREMVMADHSMMRVLARMDKAKVKKMDSQEACRVLHGLGDMPLAGASPA